MTLPRWLALVTLLAVPSAAGAHEYWLAPSRYRAVPGDTLVLGAWVGTGFRGEAKPYAASRVERFVLDGRARTDLRWLGANGDLVFARLVVPDDGGAMAGYESGFASIELPAADFDRYLELEGLDGPRRARAALGPRAGAGRERYARCAKTWIAGADPARALGRSGLTLEIVPLADPATAGALTVRVLFRGRPLAGARLRAWNRPLAEAMRPFDAAARDSLPPVADTRTGRDGVARLDVRRPGEWLLSCVHMEPCANRSAADWESWWASLTFGR